jgi:hypothetical protein
VRIIFMLCAALAVSACESPESPAGAGSPEPLFTAAELEAVDSITAGQIRPIVAELSSDRYQGRGPGTDGDRAARAFLADQLAAAGYHPTTAAGINPST